MHITSQGIGRALLAFGVIGLVWLPRLSRAEELSAEEQAAGFVSLFDGQSLNGWTGATSGYSVVDGSIQCLPDKGGNLLTEKDDTGYHWRGL